MLLSAAETARRNGYAFAIAEAKRPDAGAPSSGSGFGAEFRRHDERISMRVLTVDDSRTILAMLHHTLSNAGFEVLQAEDGQKGLDVLTRESVDVVITDINMPVMDGIEFIKRCAHRAAQLACRS